MEIIVAEGHGLVPSIIKWTTGDPYSHAAVRYGGCRSSWMVHATLGGVQPEWWMHFSKKYSRLQRYECLFPEAEEAADRLVDRIGRKDYGSLTLVGAFIEIMLGRIGIKVKNPFPNPDTFTCSELIPEYFIECNRLNPDLKLPGVGYSESITPGQVLRCLGSRGDLFRKVAEEESNAG